VKEEIMRMTDLIPEECMAIVAAEGVPMKMKGVIQAAAPEDLVLMTGIQIIVQKEDLLLAGMRADLQRVPAAEAIPVPEAEAIPVSEDHLQLLPAAGAMDQVDHPAEKDNPLLKKQPALQEVNLLHDNKRSG
jgi:hypothetical protein